MMNGTNLSFGSWKSPITSREISSETKLTDVQWDEDGETLVWLEGRSDRGVIVCRPGGTESQFDLTRTHFIRAGVGYGGGDFTVAHGWVYFIAANGLYRQRITAVDAELILQSPVGIACPTVSPDGQWIAFVATGDPNDSLQVVNVKPGSEPTVIAEDSTFYMQPAWHPSSERIAWVSWNHPSMPWEKSRIEFADLMRDERGITSTRQSSLTFPGCETAACFQPTFSPDGSRLACVSNESGWFNLNLFDVATLRLVSELREEAEHAPTAWVQGMRSYGWSPDGKQIHLIRSRNSFSDLVTVCVADGSATPVQGAVADYTYLRQIAVSRKGTVALLGSAPDTPLRLFTIDPVGNVTVRQRTSPEILDAAYFSSPDSLKWDSFGEPCHGLFWPPRNPDCSTNGLPPAIIKIHGGPTSQYFAEYDPETQFFTSRGYAVLALNYRGSSGYGSAYASLLRERWGEADVEDVRSATAYLTSTQRIDPNRIVLIGGSAGGFTLLLALIRYPGLFKAGICRYAVTDLKAQTDDTHKFEAHYLDNLIGPLPEYAERYVERSPVSGVDQIIDPVAIFQGSEDHVVPPSQSEVIAQSLARRRIPHLYKLYQGEGHGWRKSTTIDDYYQTLEWFLEQHVLK